MLADSPPPNRHFATLFFAVLVTVCTLLAFALLSSCYTQKKASRQVARAGTSFPAVIARQCAAQFPVIAHDSTRIVYREGEVKYLPGDTLTSIDTIDNVIERTVTNTLVKIRVDSVLSVRTIVKTDSARIYLLNRQVDSSSAAAGKWQDKAKTYRKWELWGWGIVIGIFLLCLIVLFVRIFKPKWL